MEFQEFVSIIFREVQERLGDGYNVRIQQLPKNNGTALTGLRIRRIKEDLALTIKIDPYFEQFENGMTIGAATDDIIGVYCENQMPDMDLEEVLDFNRAKGKVTCKLVNTEVNREWLEGIPHVEWLDLSIIFHVILERSESGQTTAVVGREQMEAWGVTVEELYRIACENTERLFPVQIMTLEEVVRDIVKEEFGDDFVEEPDEKLASSMEGGIQLYVLTNSVGIAGACYMIPGLGIERLAEQLGKDLVVLPSSIHEVLATPYEDGMDLVGLSCLVRGINQTEVAKEDRLSDRVYYVDRERGMLMVGEDGEILRESVR